MKPSITKINVTRSNKVSAHVCNAYGNTSKPSKATILVPYTICDCAEELCEVPADISIEELQQM